MATKRNIFKDVGDTTKQVAAPGGIDRAGLGSLFGDAAAVPDCLGDIFTDIGADGTGV